MKIAYDITLMQPGCVLLQAAMGGDCEAANKFDSAHWLVALTPNMKVYEVTDSQLAHLVNKTIAANPQLEKKNKGQKSA